MQGAMASVRQHVKAEFIKKESTRIIDAFASMPSSKHRAITKIVRRILINGPYLLNGKIWEVKSKSLGAGVHELWIEKVK